MGRFFQKKENNGEAPEDFVLFNGENSREEEYEDTYRAQPEEYEAVEEYPSEEVEAYPSEEVEELQNTQQIELSEVSELLEKSEYDEVEDNRKPNAFMAFVQNHRLLSVCAGIVIIALLLSASAYGVITYKNPLRKYAQVVAGKENIMRTMEVEGTLQSGNRYNITSLVAGKIIASDVEVGDTVRKDEVIYKIDDTDAKLAVERAQNELARASDTTLSESSDMTRLVSTEAGVLQTLSIKQGSSVNAGSQIGTVRRSDGTVAPLISYVSGTVAVLSVNTGRTLSVGQVIASLKSANAESSAANSKYDKKSGEIDVQAAQRHLENYTIKSPVSGVVVEKHNRVGDNVGITNSDNPMMVILDTSTLTFTFGVDEYKVREIEKGQEVTVTAESMPDETFAGEVSYVSAEGTPDENGKPIYEVCVTISDPGNLKAGMKVKAKVILASSNKAIAVPEKALLKSDGQNALVLIKADQAPEETDRLAAESLENELSYPDIKVPKGCLLMSVRYGISDGTITEILSGVSVGDTIVYNPKEDNNFVIASGDNKNKTSKTQEDKEPDYSTDTEEADSETEQQIRDRIDGLVNGTTNL